MIKLSYEQQIAFNSLSIIVGNALYALTVVLFLVPSGLITGGATGIALGINRALGLPVSGVLFVINMTMLTVGWVLLGRRFAITTIASTVLSPLFLALWERVFTFFVDGNAVLAGPGEPLGAFIAAFAGITCGHLVSGKTKVDIIVTPVITIGAGSVVGLLVGPPISQMMTGLGSIINWATEQRPFIMGIVVSVVMGMVLTLPISSAALGIILNLSGLAAGAATIGCCCNMVGFAVASYRENKFGGLVAQGLGTSMLQVPNIMRHPLIWLPVIFSSAILGPVSTIIANMQNNATGSGMGSAGLVGQITTYQTMIAYDDPKLVIIKIILLHFVLPAVITLFFSEVFRKANLIKSGDMALNL